jgi:hypothetical protein
LGKCHPRLKANLVIEQGPADNIRLELEYKQSEENAFDEVSRRWLRLRSNDQAAADFLDVNMLDVNDT